MIYLLDTNAISALMREEARMASWLASIGVDDRVVICTIAAARSCLALRDWLRDDAGPSLEGKARKLFAVLPCEPIPPAAGDWYANVKISQQRRGVPVDENDLWIAATALALAATLVSLDSDLQGIEGLAVVQP